MRKVFTFVGTVALVLVAAGLRVVGVVAATNALRGLPRNRTTIGVALTDTATEVTSGVGLAVTGTILAVLFTGDIATSNWSTQQTAEFQTAVTLAGLVLTVVAAALVGWGIVRARRATVGIEVGADGHAAHRVLALSSAILFTDMAVQVGERLRTFLNEKMPVILCTTRQDGSVQSVPVWYEYADGSILVNGGPTRDWLRHMQRDGRVTLLFVDPQNMFRWAQVQGRLAGVTEDPGGDHINHLSHRYFDRDYPGPRTDRVKIQIDPVRVTGGENREPWDVT